MQKQDVRELFPEINEITDVHLRDLATNALVEAIRSGGWDKTTVKLVPVTIIWQDCNCNLITHIHAVVRSCLAMFDEAKALYSQKGIRFDRDIVICGALLHDIGKFLDFKLHNGTFIYSETADLIRHPLGGALIADQQGLPPEIVHLIATHSFEGERSHQTAESLYVRTIDDLIFKCSVFGSKKKGV